MVKSIEKIKSREEAESLVRQWKDQGLEVVFTNGCFDIVHVGHVDYLEKARQLGDKLVVGLNTDASVSKLKGVGRPVVPESARARLLAALSFVDMVVFFSEETPKKLITTLLPDILVKGKDYAIDQIVGADIVIEYGGKVETIDLVDGFSTTNIIEKIKKI